MEEKKTKASNKCDKYNKLIKAISFEGVEITAINCTKNRDSRRDKKAIDVRVSFGIDNVVRDGTDIEISFDFELIGFFNQEQICESDEIDPQNILMNISLEISMLYAIDIEEDDFNPSKLECFEDILEEFADRNVPINAWPYVREMVSNITTRMGLPPLIMPMYKKTPKF